MSNVGVNTKAGLSSLTFQNLLLVIQPTPKVYANAPQMDHTACARIQANARMAVALGGLK